MLHSRYQGIHAAQTREEFHAEACGFVRHLGFLYFGATVVVDREGQEPEFISLQNTPAAYWPLQQDLKKGKIDPVTQHCKRNSIPIVWDRRTYESCGQIIKWEEQSAFGLSHGVSLAIHMPNGLHFMIGVDRDQPLPTDVEELHRMTADLQLFAAHAQDSALRVLRPSPPQTVDAPSLTARELECLRWTLEGKTAWELANILNIAENTAVRHLYNATQKLSAANKHHAAVKALRLKLIS